MYVSVGQSRHLAQKGAYLVVLCRGDTVFLEGCLELQLLVGLLHIHSYTLTPSHPPLPLFSPSSSPRLPLSPLDPTSVHEPTLQPFVQCLCEPPVRFAVKGPVPDPTVASLDLDQGDIDWLNTLSGGAVACVVVVWNLDTPLVKGLQTVPQCRLLKGPPPLTHGTTPATYKLSDVEPVDTSVLCLPPAHNLVLDHIVDYRGAVVLVCGDANTGKSTLCRYLVNSLLNRYERVGFLECDVGQTEFTVSMVTALHVLTEPVFGPAYTDPRKPFKAFYFGHPSPGDKPRYYVRLVQQLHSLFMSEVYGNGEVPLVINTCGWTTDRGVAILMDIIRLTSPSHIVRLVPDTPNHTYTLNSLLPFTPRTLTSTPGTVTLPSSVSQSVEEQWYSTYVPTLTAPLLKGNSFGLTPPNYIVPTPDHIVTTLDHSETTTDTIQDRRETTITQRESAVSHSETASVQRETTMGHRETTVSHRETIMGHKETTLADRETTLAGEGSDDGSSGDEVVCIDSESSYDPECDVEIIGYQPPPSPPPQGAPLPALKPKPPLPLLPTPSHNPPHQSTSLPILTPSHSTPLPTSTPSHSTPLPTGTPSLSTPLPTGTPSLSTPLPTGTPSLSTPLSTSTQLSVQEKGKGKGKGKEWSVHKRTRSEGNRDIPRSKNRKKLKRLSTNWIPYSLIPKKKRRNMGRRGLCKIDVPDQINRRTAGPSTVNTSLSLQDHWLEVERCMLERWVKVFDYDVMMLRAAPKKNQKKNSKFMRRLALVAHFSPLISGRGHHTHFLDTAPVLEIPWRGVAIHVLHKQVPRSDMMCAMRGNFIALGRVDPSQVVEQELVAGGRVLFLRSHTPIIEFLAMGVFRSSSLEKQQYYVTTPLIRDVAMDTVNVLVMGEVETMFGFSMPETTPTSFQHITVGQFAWKGHH